MKAIVLLSCAFTLLLSNNIVWSQCPSGAIGVSGAGCGCLSGCNLTAFGGPNCSGTTGNCSAGQVSMSSDITVPSGCTITVTASMSNRGASCSASGADGGDQLKVDIPGGPKSFQTGASNATLSDSYTLVGPGTIRVSGTANRADEIITYSASSVGCVNCAAGLPIELSAFQANPEDNMVACFWQTESERDNDYFTVERSSDALTFEVVGYMDGAGNSYAPLTYKLYDSSPLEGLSYYRLRQTDFNGANTTSETLAQFILQLLNLLAEGRLRNMTLLGGPGKIPRPRHGHHVSKLVHFHRQCLWWPKETNISTMAEPALELKLTMTSNAPILTNRGCSPVAQNHDSIQLT